MGYRVDTVTLFLVCAIIYRLNMNVRDLPLPGRVAGRWGRSVCRAFHTSIVLLHSYLDCSSPFIRCEGAGSIVFKSWCASHGQPHHSTREGYQIECRPIQLMAIERLTACSAQKVKSPRKEHLTHQLGGSSPWVDLLTTLRGGGQQMYSFRPVGIVRIGRRSRRALRR